MMTFHPHQPNDKGFGYAADYDDSQTLFDEYLNHDSLQFMVDCTESDRLEPLDFNFDFDEETTTSESYSADSNYSSNRPSEPSPSIPDSAPVPERSSALRPHRALPHTGPLNPSISAGELLSIEGKSELKENRPSPPTKTGVQVLRRKTKFCAVPEPVPPASQRRSEIEPSDMMQPSYYYNNNQTDITHQDWTKRFEQISLQQPIDQRGRSCLQISDHIQSGAVVSPTRPQYAQSPGSSMGHRKTVSEQVLPRQRLQSPRLVNHASHQSINDFQTSQHTQVQVGTIMEEPNPTHGDISSSNTPSRHNRQTASWSQNPTNPSPHEYTVSPNQLHTDWEQILQQNQGSYFGNAVPATSMPELPDFSATNFTMAYGAHSQLANSGTPTGFQGDRILELSSFAQSQYPTTDYTSSQSAFPYLDRPQTPSPRTNPSTPPPQEPLPSSRHNRSSKRRSKMGSLRLPKSVGNLKSSRSVMSSRDLRSPKSAGALKSSKSSGGLKSPGEFGFVNFTPDDKGKILTGVAPSGSSKTKARRELEANEKKRRLSLAAEKAIIEAGGDVEQLRREGLL